MNPRSLSLLVCAALAACTLGLERDAPVQARFLLDARRPGPDAASTPTAATHAILVENFHAASAYASARFVYRLGLERYESDFYREFLVRPERAIADCARAWIAAAGVAGAVVGPGTQIRATHVLEADVVTLHGDFRDPAAPLAVLELRATFQDATSGAVLWQHTYRAAAAVPDASADRSIEAWNQALATVLTALEADLRAVL